MPISPDDAEDLSRPVADMHSQAERGILSVIASAIARGLGISSWRQDQVQRVGILRRGIESIVNRLRRATRERVAEAAAEAISRGVNSADVDLGDRVDGLPEPNNQAGARRVADQVLATLDPVHQRMAGGSLTEYHRIVSRVSTLVEEGAATRRQAAQQALNQFADAGIRGFTDRAGRNWELTSYVEMAVRTAVMSAMIDAHIERLGQAGVSLVYVSDAPYECPLCAPWEGKVLTLIGSGQGRVRVGRHSVEVAGSLAEARAAGLFHPNCRHSLSAYIPGVTVLPTPADTGGVTYADTQKQRYLERQARKWDRRVAVATDPKDRSKAIDRRRHYRAQVRQLAANTGLPRKTHRERHDTAR